MVVKSMFGRVLCSGVISAMAFGTVMMTSATTPSGGLFAVSRAAAEDEKPRKPQTRQVQTLSKKTFEALTAAQEQIESKQYPQAMATLRAAEANQGMNEYELATIQQTYAYLFAEQENYKGAAQAFEKALAISKAEGKGLPDAQIPSIMYNLAQIYMVLEDFNTAIRWFERWTQVAESINASGYAVMATAYFQVNNFPKAEQLIKTAIDKAGAEAKEQWYQLLLAIYFERDDYKAAGGLLELMVELFPTTRNYYIQLSAIYMELGRDKESFALMRMADYQGFVEQESEFVRLAQMYNFHETPIKGAEILERGLKAKVVERKSENLELLANSYFNSREFEQAIPPLREAAQKAEKGDLYVRLGQSYMQSEKWEEARDAIRAGLRKGDLRDREEAQLVLGIVLMNMKDVNGAKKAFAEAAKSKKHKKDAQQWLKYLNSQASS